jgi:YfiH family protein
MITAPELDRSGRLRHGFFSRRGGVSEGPFASLNCGPGSGDHAGLVGENRARAMAALGLDRAALVTAHQVHSPAVAVIESPADDPGRVDGMVTTTPGLALGILTADCAPVLFADAGAGVIGAAHAGWRGVLAGVLEAVLAAMTAAGAAAADITAVIGPCIHQESYEVDGQFRDRFLAADPAFEAFFGPGGRGGHYRFDLPGLAAARLAAAGVGAVSILDNDTLADRERFFSYRRGSLEGLSQYGRGLSAISLNHKKH